MSEPSSQQPAAGLFPDALTASLGAFFGLSAAVAFWLLSRERRPTGR